LSEVKKALAGSDMVFIIAGMGGGTGTGAAPVFGQVAKETGSVSIGVVTMPFECEKARIDKAEFGLQELREVADTVIVLDNNKLVDIAGQLPMEQAFAVANELVATMIKGIVETITLPFHLESIGDNAFLTGTLQTVYMLKKPSDIGENVFNETMRLTDIVYEPERQSEPGYIFTGWSFADKGAALTFPQRIFGSTPIFLYAKWKADPSFIDVKKSYTAKSLAKQVGVKIISPKAVVSLKLSSSSKKICIDSGTKVSGSKVKTLKIGKCVVTFTVQEPKSKNGKIPKAKKITKTLTIW
jgi:hypothetical protein